ncbi:MAG: hypothetical protein IJ496_07165 [Ruminococcus sp.]|nr:hypothetical protein [Ruminococcus sp.]
MKKKNLERAAAFLTAAALTMSAAAPLSTEASDGEVIVALGDSITSGYSADGTLMASYAEMVSSYCGAELVNLAQDGATSADLLAQLSDTGVQETVAGADIILVTIGGNDIMQPVLNNDYIDATQHSTMSDLIGAMREQDAANPFFTALMMAYLGQTMPTAVSECRANIEQIAAQLRTLNGHAEIVFQTVYNPMDLDADDTPLATSGSMETLSTEVKNYLEGMENNTLYEYGVNDTIRGLQGVTVADVYETLFDRAFYYTGIHYVDVHPNSIGHLAIAETVIAAMQREETGTEDGTLMRSVYTGTGAEQTLPTVNAALNESLQARVLKNSLGDVNANGVVEISDATDALTIYAQTGASLTPSITGVNAIAADGNQDGVVDISDATLILSYYASYGAQVFTGTFEEFAAQQQ